MMTAPKEQAPKKKTENFINAVYYPDWRIYNGQSPATLNLDSVSHVFYAFAK
jgi:GH18 family chitinase